MNIFHFLRPMPSIFLAGKKKEKTVIKNGSLVSNFIVSKYRFFLFKLFKEIGHLLNVTILIHKILNKITMKKKNYLE